MEFHALFSLLLDDLNSTCAKAAGSESGIMMQIVQLPVTSTGMADGHWWLDF